LTELKKQKEAVQVKLQLLDQVSAGLIQLQLETDNNNNTITGATGVFRNLLNWKLF
jgi:hypothetical protein